MDNMFDRYGQVIVNENKVDKNKKAVAIRYDGSTIAPQVIAKGQGYMAQKILENATNENIPTYEDKELVEELTKIDLGDNIPPELYEVVAKVLVFIGDLDKMQGIRNAK